MKTLSIKQPWAELILQGRKTMEIRSWSRPHRGPLVIHAARNPNYNAMREFNMSGLVCGAIVGVVELDDVITLDAKLWEELRDQHLVNRPWDSGYDAYGWRLSHPRRYDKAIPYIGMSYLFETQGEETA